MNLLKEQEIVSQLAAFLASNDLTDNSYSRGLYEAYFALSQNAYQRLEECDRLMQQNMLMEVFNEVNKDPDLQSLIKILNFPTRDQLLDLCDLYGWAIPPASSMNRMLKIQDSLKIYDKFRILLEDYRAISRTDLHRDKLVLLRKIIKNTTQTSEWLPVIKDVEVVYLQELIERAQKDIREDLFEDLQYIQNELLHEEWHIVIPTVVMNKIANVLNAYELKKKKEEAQSILDQINAAYSACDIASLRTALGSWERFCKSKKYLPESYEAQQVKESAAFLEEKEQERIKQERFNEKKADLLRKLERNAPLDVIERDFIDLKSMELEIPDYLEDTIDQYREKIEYKNKMKTVSSAIKSICIVLFLLCILSIAAYIGINVYNEKQKVKNLQELIQAGKFEQAKAAYQEMVKKNPSLESKPNIRKQRHLIDEWEKKEDERKEHYKQLISSIESTLQLDTEKINLDHLLEDMKKLQSLAVTEKEKADIKILLNRADNRVREYKNEMQDKFQTALDEAKQAKNEFYERLERGEMENLANCLQNYEKKVSVCKSIPSITYDDYEKEILDIEKAHKEYESVKAAVSYENNFRKKLASANEVQKLSELLKTYKGNNEGSLKLSELNKDLFVLEKLFDYSGEKVSVNSRLMQVGFFKDITQQKEVEKNLGVAISQFITTFKGYQRLAKSAECYQFVMQLPPKAPIYILFDKGDEYQNPRKFRDINNRHTRITLTPRQKEVAINRGLDSGHLNEFLYAPIVFPKGNEPSEQIKGVRAVHLELCESIHAESLHWKKDEFMMKAAQKISEILNTEYCLPYWKMRLVMSILKSVSKLDPENTTPAAKFMSDLDNHKKKLDQEEGYPDTGIYDDRTQNQMLDEKLKKMNLQQVETYLKQWNLNRKLLAMAVADRFCYLGVFVQGEPLPKDFSHLTSLTQSEGDIFCLTKDRTQRVWVGTFDKNGIQIFPEYKDVVMNRVLFTSRIHKSIKNDFDKIKDQAVKENVKITLPAFMPVNINEKE